jgi:hypothetical protein
MMVNIGAFAAALDAIATTIVRLVPPKTGDRASSFRSLRHRANPERRVTEEQRNPRASDVGPAVSNRIPE